MDNVSYQLDYLDGVAEVPTPAVVVTAVFCNSVPDDVLADTIRTTLALMGEHGAAYALLDRAATADDGPDNEGGTP